MERPVCSHLHRATLPSTPGRTPGGGCSLPAIEYRHTPSRTLAARLGPLNLAWNRGRRVGQNERILALWTRKRGPGRSGQRARLPDWWPPRPRRRPRASHRRAGARWFRPPARRSAPGPGRAHEGRRVGVLIYLHTHQRFGWHITETRRPVGGYKEVFGWWLRRCRTPERPLVADARTRAVEGSTVDTRHHGPQGLFRRFAGG